MARALSLIVFLGFLSGVNTGLFLLFTHLIVATDNYFIYAAGALLTVFVLLIAAVFTQEEDMPVVSASRPAVSDWHLAARAGRG